MTATSKRQDRLIIDDPLATQFDRDRERVVDAFRKALADRPPGPAVVIMAKLHDPAEERPKPRPFYSPIAKRFLPVFRKAIADGIAKAIRSRPKWNDPNMSEQNRWEINQVRERSGLRPISGPKVLRVVYRKIPYLTTHQDYRWGGWTLQHNKRRRPVRAKAKRRGG